jgi:TPR repeat protein
MRRPIDLYLKGIFIYFLLFLITVLSFSDLPFAYAASREYRVEDIPELLPKAEAGDAEEQYWIGFFYYFGDGFGKDYDMAFQWFKKSAVQGNPKGQEYLGKCYVEGKGVKKDPVEGIRWLHKSAEQGWIGGQGNLAIAYEKGTGVKKDPGKANYWFRMAAKSIIEEAEQGHGLSQSRLGWFYERGKGGLRKDLKEAVRWYRESANQGNLVGLGNLGVCYKEGIGVQRDPLEAERWFRKAAVRGYLPAFEDLKKMGLPYVYIKSAELNPARVAPKGKFKLITRFEVFDKNNKGKGVSAKYRYKIFQGKKLLADSKDKSLNAEEGRVTKRTENLNASSRRGIYLIAVTMEYRGHTTEKKLILWIE